VSAESIADWNFLISPAIEAVGTVSALLTDEVSTAAEGSGRRAASGWFGSAFEDSDLAVLVSAIPALVETDPAASRLATKTSAESNSVPFAPSDLVAADLEASDAATSDAAASDTANSDPANSDATGPDATGPDAVDAGAVDAGAVDAGAVDADAVDADAVDADAVDAGAAVLDGVDPGVVESGIAGAAFAELLAKGCVFAAPVLVAGTGSVRPAFVVASAPGIPDGVRWEAPGSVSPLRRDSAPVNPDAQSPSLGRPTAAPLEP
jgi:hypothetical protein